MHDFIKALMVSIPGWPPARSRRNRMLVPSLLLALLVGSCAQNPVTGRNELLLVSEDWELQVGEQQYAPLRQAQGGDYTADPAVEEYVRRVGQRLAEVSDRDLPYEFNVINDSTPNAWALPGGKISINRGLLQELDNEAELAAVLGHEIVHAAAKHGARGQTRGLALQLGVITATVVGAQRGYGELAQVGSMVGAQIINSRYGRGAELEADRYGMQYMARAGYDLEGAVDLQKTFVRLSEGGRQDFLSGLFASHPPSEERVEANIETARELGRDGETGTDAYARAMQRLMRAEPAYAKYDQAQQALAEGDRAGAAALTREAIAIEPREGHFHSLLGDIARLDKDHRQAEAYYDKAISLNDDFFYYYLQRGNVRQATNNPSAARADFSKSLQLMPTAEAQAALGQIAAANGNISEARRYYAAAAQVEGPTGERARDALAKLAPGGADVASDVSVTPGVTRNGTFAVQVVNQSRAPLRNITIGVRPPGGQLRSQRLRGVLGPGESRVLDTGQTLSRDTIRQLDISVISAEPAS